MYVKTVNNTHSRSHQRNGILKKTEYQKKKFSRNTSEDHMFPSCLHVAPIDEKKVLLDKKIEKRKKSAAANGHAFCAFDNFPVNTVIAIESETVLRV